MTLLGFPEKIFRALRARSIGKILIGIPPASSLGGVPHIGTVLYRDFTCVPIGWSNPYRQISP